MVDGTNQWDIDQEKWEKDHMDAIAIAFPEVAKPAVVALRELAPGLDQIPVTKRVAGMVAPDEDKPPDVQQIPCDVPMAHEWIDWSHTQTTAYSITRMTWEEFDSMVSDVREIGQKLQAEHPNWDKQYLACRAWHAWAVRNSTNG